MVKGAARSNHPVHPLEILRGPPENIAQQPFHIVPSCSARCQFASHCQSESALCEIIGTGVDNQALGPNTVFRAKYRSILFAVGEPLSPTKPVSQDASRCLAGVQTAKRARPFARRALITARPPRVFMRTRKPCVRLRRVTEGWYVRFMTSPGSRSPKRT
jgi:hypothetical protein